MKVKVLKEYIGRNSGCLHRTGAIEEWQEVGKYGQALIDNEFVEVLDESNAEKPKEGEKYYFIDDTLGVDYDYWEDDDIDNARLRCGNLYSWLEDPKKDAKWLEATRVLREDSRKSMKGQSSGLTYSVWAVRGYLSIQVLTWRRTASNPFLFATKEDAEASIRDHEKEWQTFLGVDDAC